jgi:hypothetical protein
MQVLITRTTVANKQFVREGSTVDLDDNEAKQLIALGKAVAVGSDEPASETAVEAEATEGDELTTENAEAVVATATPKGKRRGAK